ncbi:MAG: pitrilysin family protein [Bacteroidota bacterium]
MKNKLLIALTLLSSVLFAQKKGVHGLDRSKRPTPAEAPVIKLGDIQSFELPNGLKVFVVENHKLPTVAYSIVLNIHPELEGDAAGASAIAGELLTSGTKVRTKDQLDNEIDFIGATLNTSATGVYATALKKQQNKLLELLSDVVINADFRQEELDKLKTQALSSLATEKDDPDAISDNVKSVLNFGKTHPYGEIQTEESISKITLDKCNTYYKTYFRPNVAYMAVVGDITLNEIKPLIEKYFAAWQKAEVPNAAFPMPPAPAKTRVAIVNKPGAVQSVVNVTYPVDLKPNSDDVIKAKVLNTIIGAGFSSRLFLNLREKHGFTYGSYSALNNDELVGEFSAYAKVRNDVTDSALVEIMYELNRIRSEKVPQDELDGIKNFLTGSFAIALEDPATVAKFAINTERYHLPKDYYANYLKNLAAVTSEDVYAMAQKYIRPENATILAVGDKSEISKKLERFSASKTIEFYDNYGSPVTMLSQPIPAGVTAKTVIDAYIKAIGGKSAIMEVKDVTTTMTTKFQGMDLVLVTQQKTPNKYAMSIKMGEMVIQKDVFNGVKGKQTTLQGKSEITGDGLEEIKEQATLFIEMQYEKLGYKLNLASIESINGRDAYKLEVVSPKKKKSTEYYDVESGLKVQSTTQTSNAAAGPTPIVQTNNFLEYKEVNGVKFPSSVSVTGAMSMQLTALNIEVNKGIADTEFGIEAK